MKRNSFTLLELVVVIAIIALAAGFAVSTLRTDSPVRLMEKASLDFETFCARVRFQALESGADRIVSFDRSKGLFIGRKAGTSPEDSAEENEFFDEKEFLEEEEASEEKEEAETEKTAGSILRWKLPEKFVLDDGEGLSDDLSGADGTIELFRFFPDGGGAGTRNVVFQYRSLKKVFRISPLSGRLSVSDGKEDQ